MSLLPKEKINVLALIKAGYEVHFEETPEQEELLGDIEVDDTMKVTVSLGNIPQTPDDFPSIVYIDIESDAYVAAIWTNTQGQPHRIGAPAVVHERSEKTGGPSETYFKERFFLLNGQLHDQNKEPAVLLEASSDGVHYELFHKAHYHRDRLIEEFTNDERRTTSQNDIDFDSSLSLG